MGTRDDQPHQSVTDDDVQRIVAALTLEQKASLCSGHDFWNLKEIPGLVPGIMVTDGPHGLRRQRANSDRADLNNSVPATCFPTASALASSWDDALIEEVGAAIASEARLEGVAVVLGPGANIKRSPLGGRNFEYFSEDPLLSGRLAGALIRGLEREGIGSSLKHFAVNNQEARRMTIDAVVDERALREIYLTSFEQAVKGGHPSTVMCAYNRVNGTYCSEHYELLTTILRDQWGFDGIVMTDWGAANDRVRGLEAGLDLEMPASAGVNDRLIVAAVQRGELDEAVLDRTAARMVRLALVSHATLTVAAPTDMEAHHALARQAARESAVLLANDGLLPLADQRSIAVIGAFARTPRYQGSGSSLINPWRLETAWDALVAGVGPEVHITYAPGYHLETDRRSGSEEYAPDEMLIAEAVRAAAGAEAVVIFAGLPDSAESESFDRTTLELPAAHDALIAAVAQANPRVAVVLSNGAPVAMPWLESVAAVLEGYLGGQAGGPAVADLLLGHACPSGKLAETFPRSIDDVGATPNFPGGTATVAYAESIWVGYRYHDASGRAPLFPFGHGLSYTTFGYSDLQVGVEGEVATVSFTVTNSGDRTGTEIAQVYVRDVHASVARPSKELKGWSRVTLDPGGEEHVTIRLDRRAFAFWDVGHHDWVVEGGTFDVLIGASSTDIRLRTSIEYDLGEQPSAVAAETRSRVPGYDAPDPARFADLSPEGDFARLLGRALPPADIDPGAPATRLSTLQDIRRGFVGKLIYASAMRQVSGLAGPGSPDKTVLMLQAVMREMPMRNLAMMSGGALSPQQMDGLLDLINGRPFRGVARLVAGFFKRR